jgi:predicted alpha-1,6-mannanase (GH76 family)
MLAEFIAVIKAEKDKVAEEAIRVRPGEGKDISFEYGHRQGVYAGLDKAIQLINSVVRDVEIKTRDL